MIESYLVSDVLLTYIIELTYTARFHNKSLTAVLISSCLDLFLNLYAYYINEVSNVVQQSESFICSIHENLKKNKFEF